MSVCVCMCPCSKLTQTPVPYTEVEVSIIIRTILTVLQHCHAMGVIYRDCKPDNFLLSSKGAEAVLKATGKPALYTHAHIYTRTQRYTETHPSCLVRGLRLC